MKLIYLKSALKCDSFDVGIGIKIPFFRVLVTIEPGRALLQFVTTNCLKTVSAVSIWQNLVLPVIGCKIEQKHIILNGFKKYIAMEGKAIIYLLETWTLVC